jgi:hypothetical protein
LASTPRELEGATGAGPTLSSFDCDDEVLSAGREKLDLLAGRASGVRDSAGGWREMERREALREGGPTKSVGAGRRVAFVWAGVVGLFEAFGVVAGVAMAGVWGMKSRVLHVGCRKSIHVLRAR